MVKGGVVCCCRAQRRQTVVWLPEVELLGPCGAMTLRAGLLGLGLRLDNSRCVVGGVSVEAELVVASSLWRPSSGIAVTDDVCGTCMHSKKQKFK